MILDSLSKRTVVVGLSGGVDSSLAAKLLTDQGHNVIGIFLKNWEDGSEQCSVAEDLRDAESVAEKLEIPFHTCNFSKEYWDDVFQYFLKENQAGRTPNPDILCNKYIKFGVFLKKAKELGADFIATGHYAKKVFNQHSDQFELHVPADKNKDQTYFLHALTQEQLSRSLFPLADLQKTQVRTLAEEFGFSNFQKKDSTGICFIGKRNYSEFLQQYISKKPGNIVTADGQAVGKHIGLSFYTIGQRKELGIGGIQGFPEKPWFVVRKDMEQNELMVGQDEELLLVDKLVAQKLTWIGTLPFQKSFKCQAKIRYRQKAVDCTVHVIAENRVEVIFKSAQRAVTSGQSVVFYVGEVCLGGGEIE